MAKIAYSRGQMGGEVQAPWGYYQPLEEGSLEYAGRRVIYTLGSACVEVSCCGHGSWDYARVEGFLSAARPSTAAGVASDDSTIELDTVEGPDQRTAIAQLIQQMHPGVRVEFR